MDDVLVLVCFAIFALWAKVCHGFNFLMGLLAFSLKDRVYTLPLSAPAGNTTRRRNSHNAHVATSLSRRGERDRGGMGSPTNNVETVASALITGAVNFSGPKQNPSPPKTNPRARGRKRASRKTNPLGPSIHEQHSGLFPLRFSCCAFSSRSSFQAYLESNV